MCWWFGVLVLCFVVGLIANLDMASCLVALRVVFFGCLSFGFDWFCDLLQGGIWAGVASACWVCDLVLLSPSVACGVVMVDPVGVRVVSSV